ncbi:hypothetical protein LINGRAHAP2_LOCUS31846 [Linum grandiflorum]
MVRVAAMENLLELSDVPSYVINSVQVAFFNERATKNRSSLSSSGDAVGRMVGDKAVQHLCAVCGRSLLDDCHFFSLGCKVM